MPVVSVNGLKKKFQDKEVIKGLDFELEKGKCTALIGPNGAGKTTTLRMLSGLMKPSSGTILFEGEKKDADIRKYIGYLPQFPVFYEWMTGFEFLNYVGKLGGLTNQISKARSEELLSLVGLSEARNQRIGKYSGGMKQRLGIAQAIIHKPILVMLDEPVSALDPFGRREVLKLLEQLKTEMTILFSTHILNDAQEICDQILFLHNGLIVESGTLAELQKTHGQARMVLEFREKTSEYIDDLSTRELIVSVSMEGNTATLVVKDIEEAKSVFLREIVAHNWPLVRFEIGGLNLEDMFMEVVKK